MYFRNKSLGRFLVTDTVYLTKRHGNSFQLVLPPSYLHKLMNLEELESSITINMIDSNIIRNDNQFVYQKQCAHNNMLVNIYILNTAPFIEKFVHAEIRENNVLEKEVTLCIVVDNILNKLLNNTQYTNGYRSM